METANINLTSEPPSVKSYPMREVSGATTEVAMLDLRLLRVPHRRKRRSQLPGHPLPFEAP